MIDFFAQWGGLISAIGVLASLVALVIAAYQAYRARSASEAARKASERAIARLNNYLQTVDFERAIGLIQRVKILQNHGQWGSALEHYQALRSMMSNIIARLPPEQNNFREKLTTSRAVVKTIEDAVQRRISGRISDRFRARLQEQLNDVQVNLEEIASTMGFGSPPEGNT